MSINGIKRKRENVPKRSKKQQRVEAYHSSSSEGESEDDGAGIQLLNLVANDELVPSKSFSKSKSAKAKSEAKGEDEDEEEASDNENLSEADDISDEDIEANDDDDNSDDSEEDDDDDDNDEFDSDQGDLPAQKSSKSKRTTKRDDPSALATSISKILSTKLTTQKRADPVLSRSATAAEASASVQDSKLERAAKRRLREEKHQKRERGHVKDVLALQSEDAETARVIEEERRLRKLAQRGVVRLFNAVRAAQVKGEEEKVNARSSLAGHDRAKERVTEMSKKGFLDLLNAGA